MAHKCSPFAGLGNSFRPPTGRWQILDCDSEAGHL